MVLSLIKLPVIALAHNLYVPGAIYQPRLIVGEVPAVTAVAPVVCNCVVPPELYKEIVIDVPVVENTWTLLSVNPVVTVKSCPYVDKTVPVLAVSGANLLTLDVEPPVEAAT